MLPSILALSLLSLTAFASEQERRQATDSAQFTSAADQLISEYIPSTALPALESAVSSAASAASVTGDAKSLIYEALLATSVPGWFASAVPSGWSTQIAALESNINALRPSASSGATPVVIAVTTTDSSGKTVTTSVTSTSGIATTTTATTTSKSGSGAGSTYSSLTTEVIGGITSVFSVAVSGASSVGSVAVSGASSVATAGVGGASSLISSASSKARAAAPTPVSGAAAAGVLGLVGMMIAL